MSSANEPVAGVDLAQEPDFRLGGLTVSPSTSRVRSAAGEQRIAPKVMELLVVLARHAGRTLTRDQLIDACWGGRAVTDDAVNRALTEVRALGRGLQPAPFVLETVPKVGVRLILEEGAGGAAAPARPASWRRPVAVAVAALLVLAIGGLMVWRLAGPGPARPTDQNGRVEVMSFAAQSPDPASAKVAADISDSLVRELADAGQPVAERPVARDGAGGDAEVRIAGTVEQEDANLVVKAQILDRRSGVVLWSERFVRTPLQQRAGPGEVANQVAAVLHCALQDRKVARTPLSTEAFSLYLNACAGIFVGEDSWGRMLAATRLLVKAAPQFANAHAMHAIAAANSANEAEHSPAEATALRAESRAAAEQALKLDPRTPKAYVSLAQNQGVLTNRLHQNWSLEEQYVLKGLGMDPDLPPLRYEYGALLQSTGRIHEAIELIRASGVARDPRGGADPQFAILLAAEGDLAGAEKALRDIEARYRTSENASRFTIAFWWDDARAAQTRLPTLARAGQTRLPTLAEIDTPKDELDCFETYLKGLQARTTGGLRGLPANCQALDTGARVRMLAREGDVDGAFEALKPPYAGGASVFYYPEMKAVRDDPRFWPLVKRIGLTDYWLTSDHWPDFCAEPGLDCRKAALAAAAAR